MTWLKRLLAFIPIVVLMLLKLILFILALILAIPSLIMFKTISPVWCTKQKIVYELNFLIWDLLYWAVDDDREEVHGPFTG